MNLPSINLFGSNSSSDSNKFKTSKVVPLVDINPITYKLIIIGDLGVGKTCLVKRYVNGDHTYDYASTIGVDFLTKSVEIDNKQYRLNMWDTTGQERFQSITTSFYRDTNCVLLVFDLNDLQSFTALKYYMERIHRFCNENTPIFLVGNKCDLENNVSKNDINLFIEQNNIKGYVSTSSKNNTGINDIFSMILDYVIKNQEPFKYSGFHIQNQNIVNNKKNCCQIQ
jgi:Ras-related protein Rab-1A